MHGLVCAKRQSGRWVQRAVGTRGRNDGTMRRDWSRGSGLLRGRESDEREERVEKKRNRIEKKEII